MKYVYVYDFYFDGNRCARFWGPSYEAALAHFQAHFPYDVERAVLIEE